MATRKRKSVMDSSSRSMDSTDENNKRNNAKRSRASNIGTSTPDSRRGKDDAGSDYDDNDDDNEKETKAVNKAKECKTKSHGRKMTSKSHASSSGTNEREREEAKYVRSNTRQYLATHPKCKWLIGIDEVGAGCIAGPVMAAGYAMHCTTQEIVYPYVSGVCDSKIVCRKSAKARATATRIYNALTAPTHGTRPDHLHVIVSRDEKFIDTLNIRNARLACFEDIVNQLVQQIESYEADLKQDDSSTSSDQNHTAILRHETAVDQGKSDSDNEDEHDSKRPMRRPLPGESIRDRIIILIDGNIIPDVLVGYKYKVESIIAGDQQYYPISAASIIAKVTRDGYMEQRSHDFPLYKFAKHVGYPTKEHLRLLQLHGPCGIHRHSCAPVVAARLAPA